MGGSDIFPVVEKGWCFPHKVSAWPSLSTNEGPVGNTAGPGRQELRFVAHIIRIARLWAVDLFL